MIEETTDILKLKVSRRKAKRDLKEVVLKGKSVLMLYQNYNESVSNRKIIIISTQSFYSLIPNEGQIFVCIYVGKIIYKWWHVTNYFNKKIHEGILPYEGDSNSNLPLSDDIKSAILKKISESRCRIFSEEAYRGWRTSVEMVLGIIGNSAWITKFDNRHTKNLTHRDEPLFDSFERQLSFLEEGLNRIKSIPKETFPHNLIKWFSQYVIKVAVERTVDNTIGTPKI